ncbi:MAG TPA: GMC family oxidoreductase [Pseudorhodoplanes sp.]|jgi:choline dehydrogenase|nr:GMC family oxidoreductase [Pseudorhodoplanes sp.]
MAGHEVIVVGAGSAGCVLAARLVERGASVLLLEAGPDYVSQSSLPPDIADARMPTFSHDWGYSSVAGNIGRELPLPRGRLVGGCSATNACFALRGSPADYDAWASMGNEGWSFDECLPFFRASETDADFGSAPWHGASGPLPIRRYREDERNGFQQGLILAAARHGHTVVEDHNAPGAVGVGPLPVNAVNGVRISTAQAYLGPLRGSANLTVRAGALVDRVVLQSGCAVGVRLASSGAFVGAELVIVAAGTYASPAVLMRSGIGPAARLAALGARCHVDLPGVGGNLADHPWVPVRLPVSIPTDGPGFQTVLTWRSAEVPSSSPPDLQIFAQGPFLNEGVAVASLCAALLKPRSRGRVALRSLDPAAPPVIDLALLTDNSDLRRLVEGVRHARQLLGSPDFDLVARNKHRRGGGLSDGELKDEIHANVRTYHHPVGTCAMGPDPSRFVVDFNGHVHGTERLLVADASIMPEIPSANTNLPTIMIAERIAAVAKA